MTTRNADTLNRQNIEKHSIKVKSKAGKSKTRGWSNKQRGLDRIFVAREERAGEELPAMVEQGGIGIVNFRTPVPVAIQDSNLAASITRSKATLERNRALVSAIAKRSRANGEVSVQDKLTLKRLGLVSATA